MNTHPLISVDELSRNPDSYLVLEASDPAGVTLTPRGLRGRYDNPGHIPGAQFVDLIHELSDPLARFPYTRPDASAFTNALRHLGVCADSQVVVYDRANGIWAARVWWLLKSFGHTRVSVLDGGLKAWSARGLTLQRGTPRSSRGDFTAVPVHGYFVDRHDVEQVLAGDRQAQLVNVLRRSVFRGEQSKYARPGHIPGSLNLPYIELIDATTNTLLNARELLALLQQLTTDPALEQVLYCGSGITAAGVALALAVVGFDHVTVYDGSLSEWSADPALAMSAPAAPLNPNI